MRVLTLTNLYPNPFHPHRAVFNRWQLRLMGERHDVRVIAPIAWTDEFRARWQGSDRLPRDRQVTLDGLTVDHPRYWFPPRLLRGSYGHCFCWSVRTVFAKAVAEFTPDILYAPWAYPDGWAGVQLGHKAGLPVVVKVFGSDILHLEKYPGRQRGTIAALRLADGIIAVSQDLANRIEGFGVDPERIEVIYDGVDRNLFRQGSVQDARRRLGLEAELPMILFIGNLVAVKGIDVLVDACARLASAGVAFTCNCIGQGPLRATLQRQINRLGLESRVRLLGPKHHEELADWYRAANVFVLASHSEGVPNVLLEAAACGTPFVASRVGGIPEIAHVGASRLVAPGEAATLAEAIAAYLNGPETPAKHFSVRGLEEVVAEMTGVLERARERYHALAPVPACAEGRC